MADADDLDRATDTVDPAWEWTAEHTRKYLASGGADGHERDGVHNLILVTTGRKSGLPRRTPLIYGVCGQDFVVVASKGGADSHPAWYLNLVAEPSVGVQVGARRFTARAHVATSQERRRLWPLMVGIFPLYAQYQDNTDREIPVVVLTPRD